MSCLLLEVPVIITLMKHKYLIAFTLYCREIDENYVKDVNALNSSHILPEISVQKDFLRDASALSI